MKTWLKGGLIATGIAFIIWVILFIFFIVTCKGEGCMIAYYSVPIGFWVILLIFIFSSIISAIISRTVKLKTQNTLKGLQIGFWIGLIGVIIYNIAKGSAYGFSTTLKLIIQSKFANLGDYFFMGIIFFSAIILGAIIGLIIQKVKK